MALSQKMLDAPSLRPYVKYDTKPIFTKMKLAWPFFLNLHSLSWKSEKLIRGQMNGRGLHLERSLFYFLNNAFSKVTRHEYR